MFSGSAWTACETRNPSHSVECAGRKFTLTGERQGRRGKSSLETRVNRGVSFRATSANLRPERGPSLRELLRRNGDRSPRSGSCGGSIESSSLPLLLQQTAGEQGFVQRASRDNVSLDSRCFSLEFFFPACARKAAGDRRPGRGSRADGSVAEIDADCGARPQMRHGGREEYGRSGRMSLYLPAPLTVRVPCLRHSELPSDRREKINRAPRTL